MGALVQNRIAEPVEARLADKRPLRLPTYGSRSGQASTGSGLRYKLNAHG